MAARKKRTGVVLAGDVQAQVEQAVTALSNAKRSAAAEDLGDAAYKAIDKASTRVAALAGVVTRAAERKAKKAARDAKRAERDTKRAEAKKSRLEKLRARLTKVEAEVAKLSK